MAEFTKVKGYALINGDKAHRVMSVFQRGARNKAEEEIAAIKNQMDNDEDALLAAYDREAGAILKDGEKVETGTFWDFENKQPREVKKATKKTATKKK